MHPRETCSRPVRVRHVHLIVSLLVIGLVTVAALIAPHVIHTAHATAPKNPCAQLPAGVDPTMLAPHQLQMYGLPPRLPGQSQTMWEQIVRHARHRACAGHGATPVTEEHAPAIRGAISAAAGQFASSGTHRPSFATGEHPAGTTWHADSGCSSSCDAGLFAVPDPGATFADVWGN